eukprot:13307721-Alexandrium_andersonii.AAC.1
MAAKYARSSGKVLNTMLAHTLSASKEGSTCTMALPSRGPVPGGRGRAARREWRSVVELGAAFELP